MFNLFRTFTCVVRNSFLPDHKMALGRWRTIHDNNIVLNKRIELANEDHCGPCGQYILNKYNKEIKHVLRA